MVNEPSALQLLLDEFRDQRQETRKALGVINQRLQGVEGDIKKAKIVGYAAISVVASLGAVVGWGLKTAVAAKEFGQAWLS